MRELLFRGQIRRKGEKVYMDGSPVPSRWIYGGVLQGKGDFSVIYGCEKGKDEVIDFDKFPVYTNTLGQYTGATDCTNEKIFEGDLLKVYAPNIDPETDGFGKVEWNDNECCFIVMFDTFFTDFGCISLKDVTIVGNIFDNPELYNAKKES